MLKILVFNPTKAATNKHLIWYYNGSAARLLLDWENKSQEIPFNFNLPEITPYKAVQPFGKKSTLAAFGNLTSEAVRNTLWDATMFFHGDESYLIVEDEIFPI